MKVNPNHRVYFFRCRRGSYDRFEFLLGVVNHIEVQALSPMTAPNEMAGNVDAVLGKLRKDTAYVRMFKATFGSTMIHSQRMLKAIAQFVGSTVSSNSKYDNSFRNNGLPLSNYLKDYGRMRITEDPADSLKFMVRACEMFLLLFHTCMMADCIHYTR